MNVLLSLLGNRYTWIALVLGGLGAGAWFKITSLERDVAQAHAALATQVADNKVLASNNAVLKQNLEEALRVNKDNALTIKQIKDDQLAAARSLQKLSSDLSATKRSLAEARKKLEDATTPTYPVPPNIVNAVEAIQSARDEVKD